MAQPSAATALPYPTLSMFTRIRLASAADIPHMHSLIHQLAVFEHLTHQFQATAAALSATLFRPDAPPPFTSVTTLLLELSSSPFPPSKNPHFTPLVEPLHLDPTWKLPETEGITVAGFVLFFPNYSTYLAKQGFYVQNIYVRKRYRRMRMGKMLLAAVAAVAAKMGYGKLEWIVADWNVDAGKFYEHMGAEVLPERNLCRLTGDALEAYANVNL